MQRQTSLTHPTSDIELHFNVAFKALLKHFKLGVDRYRRHARNRSDLGSDHHLPSICAC